MSKGVVLITRPRMASARTAQALSARGWDSFIAPMLEIVPRSGALPDLSSFDALAFTSANAVDAFAAAGGEASRLPVYAVGAATAEAACNAGFENVRTGGGTVKDLNALLAGEGLKNILHLSGAQVAAEIAVPGAHVERTILYDARPATALPPPCRAALAQGRFSAALFFSPRTAQVFRELVSAAQLEQTLSGLRALCISPEVVKCLRNQPWMDIRAASAPDFDSMVELLDMEHAS